MARDNLRLPPARVDRAVGHDPCGPADRAIIAVRMRSTSSTAISSLLRNVCRSVRSAACPDL
jgi:hypothetical protein